MTLWDIFDAWTDSALEAPARDNGTHAERIEELKGYTDACSYRDYWDCAPVTDEEAEIRISPRGQVLAEDDDCSFFVEEQINIKWVVKK